MQGLPFSGAEVAEVVKRLLGGKDPGVDEVRPEFLKALDVVELSWLTRLCNIAWTSGTVPLDWQIGMVVPLFKKSLHGKVYSGVLERRILLCQSLIRIAGSKSDVFPVRVGLHQGYPLSPILFIIFMDRNFRCSQGIEGSGLVT